MYQVTQNNNLFNLSLNENYFSFCKAHSLTLHNLNRYPNTNLYKQIEAEAQKLYNTNQPILLTNGSDDGIFLLQQFHTNAPIRFEGSPPHGRVPDRSPSSEYGAPLIITNPTFSMYENYAKNLKIPIIKIDLTSHLQINLPKLKEAISLNPNSITFIPNPNSPTGTMLSNAEIEELLQFGTHIVIDEAYIEFSGKQSALPLMGKYPNLTILRTLSKFYGIAGARIGFIISQHTQEIKRFQAPFSVSSLNADVALRTLQYVNSHTNEITEFTQNFIQTRNTFIENLKQMQSVIEIYKTETNFVLVKTTNSNQIAQNCTKHGLLIKDFSPSLPETIRFSLADDLTNAKLLSCF